MKIIIVGSGYVGLVSAAGLASLGHHVRAIDVSHERIEQLQRGVIPFWEPGLDALVHEGAASGRLCFEVNGEPAIAGADVVLVAVGTHDGNGGWQSDALLACLRSIAASAGDDTVIAIRSTVPPERLERMAAVVREVRARAASAPLAVVLNPEFTREGTAVRDFLQPDRIVLGALDDPGGLGIERMRELYAPLDAPVLVMSGHDACLTKLGANLFLATKVSFANELARLCDRYGANVERVVEGMALDPRIGGAFLRAGVGFGGSCLPHQVAMVVKAFADDGDELPLLGAVDRVNRGQRHRFVGLLDDLVGGLDGRRVAMLGLTFKPGTDDLRDAPAVSIAGDLIARGASVVAADPMASARRAAEAAVQGLRTVTDPLEAATEADAIALVTEWPEFLALDWAALAARARGRVVVDGRNVLDVGLVTSAGFSYAGFGRGLVAAAQLRPSDRAARAAPRPSRGSHRSFDSAPLLELATGGFDVS